MVGLIAGLTYFLLFTQYFNIREVEVKGAVSLDHNIILEMANIGIGENIFLQNNLSRENSIKKNFSIIKSIKIKQQLPGKVIIEINEKIPRLVLATNSSYLLIGDNGEVLDLRDKLNNLSIPLMTGVNLIDKITVGQVVVQKDVAKVLNFIKLVPAKDLDLLEEVSVLKDDIVIFPNSSFMVIVGDSENIEKKMLILKTLIKNTNILVNTIDYIDISNPEKIIKKIKEDIS